MCDCGNDGGCCGGCLQQPGQGVPDLYNTPGVGNVVPPGNGAGSGDKFGCFSEPKKKKKKIDEDPYNRPLIVYM